MPDAPSRRPTRRRSSTTTRCPSSCPSATSAGHKGSFGRVLVLAGSMDYAGAALLVCRAAGRAGAGLVTLAVPESLQPLFAAKVVEATTMALPEDDVEEVDPEPALAAVLDHEHDALVIGPGLRPSLAIAELLRLILTASEEPGRAARGARRRGAADAGRGGRVVDAGHAPVRAHAPHRRVRPAARRQRPRRRRGRRPQRRRRRSRAGGRVGRRGVAAGRRAQGRQDGHRRPRTARWRWRRSRTPRWRAAARATSCPGRSARCSRRAWRHRMRRGWASTCTDWPARPSATGSGTPGCSPATCRTRCPIGRKRLARIAERQKTGRRLGFGVATTPRGPTLRPPSAGTPAQAGLSADAGASG